MNNEHDVTPQTADHSVYLDESADQKRLGKIRITTVTKKNDDISNPDCSLSKVLKCYSCDDTHPTKPIHLKISPPKGTTQDDSNEPEFISHRQRNSPALTKRVGRQNP